MIKHPYVETIETYYLGCNARDFDLMVSTFVDDVVHYFVDHAPVRGAQGLANYWCKVAPKTAATWAVDHAIVAEPEAVIEWSMPWTPPVTGAAEVLRGTEWFVFTNGKIAEIRSYHCNFFLNAPKNRALHGFDYASRGYPN
jgi:hypothetical protein